MTTPDTQRERPPHRCPTCAQPVDADSEFMPFCSHHCKLVDLGKWFDGSYRVSRPADDRDSEQTD